MNLPPLTPQEIEANKALGINPMFWETARPIPAVFTADWLTEMFPSWRAVGQEIVNLAAQGQSCKVAS